MNVVLAAVLRSTSVLATVALLVLATSVWAYVSQRIAPVSDSALLFDDPRWHLWLTASGAAWVVAAYVGVAALQTAAAMRVLSPDRPLPARQPHLLRAALPASPASSAGCTQWWRSNAWVLLPKRASTTGDRSRPSD